MRLGFRNTKTIYYALFDGKQKSVDEDGNYTGDYELSYSTPESLDANVVSKNSSIAREYFGEQLDYNKVILTESDCPIQEDSIIWIGTESPIEDSTIKHNYHVKSIGESLNYKAIAVKKVT